METFQQWYDELIKIAKAEDLLWLISDDPEDHREGYLSEMTPEEELYMQKTYCC